MAAFMTQAGQAELGCQPQLVSAVGSQVSSLHGRNEAMEGTRNVGRFAQTSGGFSRV